jgi:hypothetical protein
MYRFAVTFSTYWKAQDRLRMEGIRVFDTSQEAEEALAVRMIESMAEACAVYCVTPHDVPASAYPYVDYQGNVRRLPYKPTFDQVKNAFDEFRDEMIHTYQAAYAMGGIPNIK